jgi:RNA recognition motif-containing protein
MLCARVVFEREELAQYAVDYLGGQGGNIRFDNEPELDDLNVFVSNLPSNVTETELKTAFEMFGPVLTVGLLDKTPDGGGPRRIFGFARFRYSKETNQSKD